MESHCSAIIEQYAFEGAFFADFYATADEKGRRVLLKATKRQG